MDVESRKRRSCQIPYTTGNLKSGSATRAAKVVEMRPAGGVYHLPQHEPGRSIISDSTCLPWSERDEARLLAVVSVLRCSAPSTARAFAPQASRGGSARYRCICRAVRGTQPDCPQLSGLQMLGTVRAHPHLMQRAQNPPSRRCLDARATRPDLPPLRAVPRPLPPDPRPATVKLPPARSASPP